VHARYFTYIICIIYIIIYIELCVCVCITTRLPRPQCRRCQTFAQVMYSTRTMTTAVRKCIYIVQQGICIIIYNNTVLHWHHVNAIPPATRFVPPYIFYSVHCNIVCIYILSLSLCTHAGTHISPRRLPLSPLLLPPFNAIAPYIYIDTHTPKNLA